MDPEELRRLNELTGAMSQSNGESPAARLGIYGPSGVGKSFLALQIANLILPEDRTLLWVDSSDNVLIKAEAKANGLLRSPWTRLPFTFQEDLEILAKAIANKVPPYDTVGMILLDEFSKMVQEDVDRVWAERVKSGKSTSESPDFTDGKITTARFRRVLNELYKAEGLHIIMLAHEFVPGMMSKEKARRADYNPAFYKFAKEKVSAFIRLSADEISGTAEHAIYRRQVQVHPTSAADAKSRLGISTVKFDAEFLPQGIKDWLDSGGTEFPEVVEAKVEPDPTPPVQDESDIPSFEPI